MSYSLAPLDGGHIISFTMHEDFDFTVDMPKYLQECWDLVENGPDRIVIISDASAMKTKNLDYLIQGTNSIRTPEAQRLTHHPKVVKNFTVVSGKLAHLAVKGLNSATFGYVDLLIFETPEEAINEARSILFGQSKAE